MDNKVLGFIQIGQRRGSPQERSGSSLCLSLILSQLGLSSMLPAFFTHSSCETHNMTAHPGPTL